MIIITKNTTNDCCICMNNIKKNKNNIKCNICVNTYICYTCSLSMLENGQLLNCPVCRSEEWYKKPTKKIKKGKYGCNNCNKYKRLFKKLYFNLSWCCKFLWALLLLWCFGISVILLFYQDYINHLTVFTCIIPLFPGIILFCCGHYCINTIIYSND